MRCLPAGESSVYARRCRSHGLRIASKTCLYPVQLASKIQFCAGHGCIKAESTHRSTRDHSTASPRPAPVAGTTTCARSHIAGHPSTHRCEYHPTSGKWHALPILHGLSRAGDEIDVYIHGGTGNEDVRVELDRRQRRSQRAESAHPWHSVDTEPKVVVLDEPNIDAGVGASSKEYPDTSLSRYPDGPLTGFPGESRVVSIEEMYE
eukprot:m.295098 g.295098  ORF g.295098 m.295098 type:complete len:206 (-) comp20037_c0_seq5:75-692(-)